jgi:1,6-anhydro-N-acetylmuramate kinase
MTGTSLDALDASLVLVRGEGLDLDVEQIRSVSVPLGPLGAPLRALAQGQPTSAGQIARLRDAFSNLHAQALTECCDREEPLSLVAVHGQTVFHEVPHSWQLINPWPIARRLNCPVVHDLRGADIALGGQGAPITPLADWVLFRDEHKTRAIVNLGGFCNVTILPGDGDTSSVRGFDVCACNQVLDACAQRVLGADYDEEGAHAARGTRDDEALGSLLRLLGEQSNAGRSLGSGDECAGWIDTHASALSPEDLLASAVHAVARPITDRLSDADEIYLAGGSTQNRALRHAIETLASAPVHRLDLLGVDALYREPIAIAVLGALCMDRVPITLPDVTGREESTLLHGCWANAPMDADTLR